MKSLSNLGAKLSCLPVIAGKEASAILYNPRYFLSGRVGADSRGAWLPADTKRDPQALFPGSAGGVGHRERLFLSVKRLIFFAGQRWQSCCGRQPGSQTQARWVSRLCVEKLPVVD